MGAYCCHGNQTKRQITINLGIFNCPYPSNICTKLEAYCFSGFGVVINFIFYFIYFFLNLMLPWQPNTIVTGHKTHKLCRQSSTDHNCQIWFTLLHWLWQTAIQPFFHYMSMGVFFYFNYNQAKRQITIILAIFKSPYPSNILT